MSRVVLAAILCALLAALACRSLEGGSGERGADAVAPGAMPESLVPRSWWVLPPVDDRGRRPFRPDAVLRDQLLDPRSAPPREGDLVRGELSEPQRWERRDADQAGRPRGAGPIGWATTTITAPHSGMMIARLSGALDLWANGHPVVGDYYSYGSGGVPVWLKQGENRFWVHGIRGSMGLVLNAAESVLIHGRWGDVIPDLISGAGDAGPLGVLLLNGSPDSLASVTVSLSGDELFEPVELTIDHDLRPLSLESVSLPQRLRDLASVPVDVTSWLRRLEVRLDGESEPRLVATIELPIQDPDAARRVTFVSEIDGSVQFYALLPPDPAAAVEPAVEAPSVSPGRQAGLVLSLHGAGVDALGQVLSYAPKPDFWIVAPTNRRPFGFDWQDWGRQDAYEVLEHALARTGVRRSRVYLTGHSMGGHGSWHLAANDPDGFAAVAPSAGWESFDSYGGRPEGERKALWLGADGASRTLELIDNLVQVPAFVLHGEQDDNVPIDQAKMMIAALQGAGASPRWHFQPGAGHWWDGQASAGTDCTDWPGIFALFRSQAIEQAPAEISFSSMDPGVDSTHFWVSLLQPLRYGSQAVISASWDASTGTATVETDNVRALALLEIAGEPVPRVQIDGSQLELGSWSGSRILIRDDEGWRHGRLALGEKRPSRCGPFKRAFDQDFVFVVGTHGEQAMTVELAARARKLAQDWWYRANGQATILDDDEYLRHPPRGNPILLGNESCNSAWKVLLPPDGEPIRWAGAPWPDDWRAAAPVGGQLVVSRGAVQLGDRQWSGDDLGAVFVRPRPGGLVGAFGFSGVPAVRASYVLSPFVSGVGYPDYAVFDSSVLTDGDGGVLAAGWFDNRWRLSGS